ncbi:MAG TPA: hypothetical protein VMA09_24035 [Candidatus Binataceae bacterium]|nr:hypothetical protein [Candidatus Binataceae bacterium]
MRKIAFLTILLAMPMMAGRAHALSLASPILGMNGQPLQGTYVCKGQGHTQTGQPTGIYIVLRTDGTNVTGGELGEHVNTVFCNFTIASDSSMSVDAEDVGHLSLDLKPAAPAPSAPSLPLIPLLTGCRQMTDTFEFTGLNHGNTQVEISETDSPVEAGGLCRLVSPAF